VPALGPMALGPAGEPQPHLDEETLIFVDVDGVLNLAVRDPEDAAPVGLSHENIDVARKVWAMRKRRLRGEPMIERILDVHDRKLEEGEGEAATYAKLAHREAVGLSDVLVERLARLIRTAPCCTVVLSSTWRMPEHKFRVQRLEAALGHHLGSPRWAFHARTSLAPERGATERLQRIGDFVVDHLARGRGRRELRVLVLDDFMVNAFHGWPCGGCPMDSCEAAERYLSDRAARGLGREPACDLAVRVIHTYDEWTTASSLFVQVGTGLTIGHFRRAESFLLGSAADGLCDGGGATKLVCSMGRPPSERPTDPERLRGVEATPPAKRLALSVASAAGCTDGAEAGG